jgi:hypothetical protein
VKAAQNPVGWASAHRSTTKESRSFLKKRTKKLLPVTVNARVSRPNVPPGASSKSFLLLFFKKEESSLRDDR